MEHYNLNITDENSEKRIDRFLSEYFSEYSRSFFQKLIKEKQILVNKKEIKSNYKLNRDDILYEDEDLIIVNKPKGMVVHPSAGHYSNTLVNALLYHCKDQLSGINGTMRPGIVHRIDQNTTGSLVVCKNDFSHNSLAEQLKEHSITRKYRAIVHGILKEDEGTIDQPIGRHPIDRKKMAINHKNGKYAVTHYRVLERFQNFTYIECQLETGRTHQIRVHMSSIHHPILGDDVYGPSKCPYHLQGQTLHAMVIGFIHPRTETYLEITAPLPTYFEELLCKLRR